MAEVTGLILEGVTLVGLMSTCVEILEYLESARNRPGDFGVALVKVNLIKQRLSNWGADANSCFLLTLQTTSASSHCKVLIQETLARIQTLLDQTNRMSRRHSVQDQYQRDIDSPPRPPMRLPFRSKPVGSDNSVPVGGGKSFKSPPPRRSQPLVSFSRKVLWVLLDKKRLDNLIEQLDFLLSNLEKITETLHGRAEMAQNSGSGKLPAYSNCKNETVEDPGHQATVELDMVIDIDNENKAMAVEACPDTSLYQPSRALLQCHHGSNNHLHPGSYEAPQPPE